MKLQFDKYADGLVPAIVQDASTRRVLMLGFMNAEAFRETNETGKVTFYSRSKQRLWTKGESSGNFLMVRSISIDCDADTLLIHAEPKGPVCHTGSDTCFQEINSSDSAEFLSELESTIRSRRTSGGESSYVAGLFAAGLNRIAQKVGEEAVETVIAAKDEDADIFKSEAADLVFHLLILLNAKGTSLAEVTEVLRGRSRKT